MNNNVCNINIFLFSRMLRSFVSRSISVRSGRFKFDNDFYYAPKENSQSLSFDDYMAMLETINQRNGKHFFSQTSVQNLLSDFSVRRSSYHLKA